MSDYPIRDKRKFMVGSYNPGYTVEVWEAHRDEPDGTTTRGTVCRIHKDGLPVPDAEQPIGLSRSDSEALAGIGAFIWGIVLYDETERARELSAKHGDLWLCVDYMITATTRTILTVRPDCLESLILVCESKGYPVPSVVGAYQNGATLKDYKQTRPMPAPKPQKEGE